MATTTKPQTALHLLVVIDHQEARIYQNELHGSVPERVTLYDPHGFKKHLHSALEWTNGKRLPERKSFYEAVAKTLQGADQVLIFGSGTGRSSAMNMLVEDLQAHHKDLAKRIIGAIVIDNHHTTENQILAKARTFYAEHNK